MSRSSGDVYNSDAVPMGCAVICGVGVGVCRVREDRRFEGCASVGIRSPDDDLVTSQRIYCR